VQRNSNAGYGHEKLIPQHSLLQGLRLRRDDRDRGIGGMASVPRTRRAADKLISANWGATPACLTIQFLPMFHVT